MGTSDDTEPRDRQVAAYSPASRWPEAVTRAARPAVIGARRLTARLRPVLRRSGAANALQASLLAAVDVSGYNRAGPPSFANLQSQAVSAAQILEPTYRDWAARLGEEPRFHRKQWEHVAILAAAGQAGLLQEGRSAIGFGVGTEPIPAALASYGVTVVATDRPEDAQGHWSRRGEYSQNISSLVKPEICDAEDMRRLVTFRPVDMAHLPADLGTFDIVWSACALEHLGSPEAGLVFAERSLDLLNPGGVAVHTTEFDLTPGATTVDYGNCAVYRLSDLEAFAAAVRGRGFDISINPYVAFEHPADRSIAPPLSEGTERYHLKLALYRSITTSFALIVRRPR